MPPGSVGSHEAPVSCVSVSVRLFLGEVQEIDEPPGCQSRAGYSHLRRAFRFPGFYARPPGNGMGGPAGAPAGLSDASLMGLVFDEDAQLPLGPGRSRSGIA